VGIEEIFDTGIYETVYNLRVSNEHTYFVGTIAGAGQPGHIMLMHFVL
jgi:hypothetical protein